MSTYDDVPMWDHDDTDDDTPVEVTCKFCGKGGLAWERETGGRWILYSIKSGQIHQCHKPVVLDLNKPI